MDAHGIDLARVLSLVRVLMSHVGYDSRLKWRIADIYYQARV